MKMNLDKCKVFTDLNETIKIEEQYLENVAHFVYLGSSVPDTVKDVERRIGLVLSAFGRLRKSVWSNRDMLLSLKVRLQQVMTNIFTNIRISIIMITQSGWIWIIFKTLQCFVGDFV